MQAGDEGGGWSEYPRYVTDAAGADYLARRNHRPLHPGSHRVQAMTTNVEKIAEIIWNRRQRRKTYSDGSAAPRIRLKNGGFEAADLIADVDIALKKVYGGDV